MAKIKAWRQLSVDAVAFRDQHKATPCEVLRGVRVYYPRSLAEFDAVQYVLCTDAVLGVQRSPSGAIAAYRDGEFCGWQPSIEIAVEVCRSNWR